jgi:hypothetical protein
MTRIPTSHPLQVAVGGQDIGEVDDAGSLTDVAVGVDRGLPRLLGHPLVQRGGAAGQGEPDLGVPPLGEYVSHERNSFVPPPPSARTSTLRPGRDGLIPGSAFSASVVTAM